MYGRPSCVKCAAPVRRGVDLCRSCDAERAKPIRVGTDYSSKEGATVLAKALEGYWADRGSPHVRFRVKQVTGLSGFRARRVDGGLPVFTVCSNLVNGLPPRVA